MSGGDDRFVARYPVRIRWYPNDYARLNLALSVEPYTGIKTMRNLAAAIREKGADAYAEANIGSEARPHWTKFNTGA